MKPRDYPRGRTGPTEEEPFVIEMSVAGPEEAGANARSPSPEYETVEVAEVLMAEVEAKRDKVRSPEYEAPGSRSPSKDPGEKSPVLNAYYTQNFRPRQVYGPRTVPQVVETRKRSKEEEAQDERRGRQRRQEPGARSKERQDSGASEDRVRTRSQGAFCYCKVCQTMPRA